MGTDTALTPAGAQPSASQREERPDAYVARAGRGKRTVSVVRTLDELEALRPEWRMLYEEARPGNPFADPDWLKAWAERFVDPGELYVVTVRDRDEVTAVAPFFRMSRRIGPRRRLTRLQPLGTGHHWRLTELPEILLQRGLERSLLREIVGFLAHHERDWDWAQITLTPRHGWIEPQWLPESRPGAGNVLMHKATRPCVVLPLPERPEALDARLKRNVKEALRRARNRLATSGLDWSIECASEGEELAEAVRAAIRLHQGRAALDGRPRHSDYVPDPADHEFLADAVERLAGAGNAHVYTLVIDGEVAAAQVVLRGHGTLFFSLSGLDPRWWDMNALPLLLHRAMTDGIDLGDRLANLSVGPSVAKLRWSEQLELHQDFILVGARRLSRLAFSAYWQARAGVVLRGESLYQNKVQAER